MEVELLIASVNALLISPMASLFAQLKSITVDECESPFVVMTAASSQPSGDLKLKFKPSSPL